MTHPIKPNAGILDIIAYKPGKTAQKPGQTVYKLSANESALGPSPKSIEAVQNSAAQVHMYPNGPADPLKDAIHTRYGLKQDLIVCGCGSDEILQLLCKAYLSEGDSIVQTKHGFAVYRIAAASCGAKTIFADETNLTADVDKILAAVEDNTRIVFIANPNNPTGTSIPTSEMQRLRDGLRDDILLVIDAAYAEYQYTDHDNHGEGNMGIDFVNDSIENKLENVVTTRTFSKIYGLGGLRVGYGYCPPSVADILNRIRGPFNVNAPAIAAAAAAILDTDFETKNRAYNADAYAALTAEVEKLGFHVTPSDCNFILVRMRSNEAESRAAEAKAMFEYLASEGVFIRMVNEYFLDDYVRMSIGAPDGQAKLIELLKVFASTYEV